jgi:hypothetical protein
MLIHQTTVSDPLSDGLLEMQIAIAEVEQYKVYGSLSNQPSEADPDLPVALHKIADIVD